ncbi:MAG: HAMP domain-containing histidine kinase [Proteobacteria bacterium]|nr:MAG: HAMP domain-containing histidine kinase [Pseudomonadota bacterium]
MAKFSQAKRLQNKKFQDLSRSSSGWLFSIEENIRWTDIPNDPARHGATEPGPFRSELYYFLFNEPTKMALSAAGVPLDVVQGMTSIGMFRDGFRVRMDDDWLELSQGVTSGGFFQLRPKNVIGFFEISNELNPELVEKSDREGFVDNPRWRGFRLLADRAKKWSNDSLEAVRSTYDIYKKDVIGQEQESSDDPSNVRELLSKVSSSFESSLSVAQQRVKAASSKLAQVRRRLETDDNEKSLASLQPIEDELTQLVLEFELISKESRRTSSIAEQALDHSDRVADLNSRLIDAAAVGLSARALSHELSTYISQIEKGLGSVKRANRAKQDPRLELGIEHVTGAVRELKKSVSSINPLLTGSRSLKEDFYPLDAINEFQSARLARIEEANVNFQVSGIRGPKIRFAKARFVQVLENLFQNSLYWIAEHAEKSKHAHREITVVVDGSGFIWYDGARGVRDSIAEAIFDPYVTDKPASKGQGLGLYLTTAFLEAEKCHIFLLPDRNEFDRRFKFRVELLGAKVR